VLILTKTLRRPWDIQQFSIWLCGIAKSSKNGFGFVNTHSGYFPSQQKRILFSK